MKSILGFLVVLTVNLALIGTFYNKSWIPSDDGHYVHVADRILQGQVLNADVEEMHPGYIHFINATALHIFGDQIASLRIPLMALMLFQSLIIFELFRLRATVESATVAAILISTVGILQLANPTTSLYALGATVALAATLSTTTPGSRKRALMAGLLIGFVFMFRQLTGAFVAIGALAFLLTEPTPSYRGTKHDSVMLARLILVVCFSGLLVYLVTSATPPSFLLFGACPLAILIWAFFTTTVTNRQVTPLIGYMTVGGLASAMPVITYHIWNGSLLDWLRDTFVRALSITELPHLAQSNYLQDILIPASINLMTGTIIERLNGFYWIALLICAPLVAIRLLNYFRNNTKSKQLDTRALGSNHAVPILAVFCGLIPVFNQIPYYLYQYVGFALIAFVWITFVLHTDANPLQRFTTTVAALLIGAIGLWSHAGQPYTRSIEAVVAGERTELQLSEIDRMGIWIDPVDNDRYAALIKSINQYTEKNDIIFAAPNSAELYFLSERTNAFRLFNPTISILNSGEADGFIEKVREAKPVMILHDTSSVYNTIRTLYIMDTVLKDYTQVDAVDTYKVYLRNKQG
ncbi:hypothetical protein AB833_10590 [Chromatiales bacterium (ex Bugula neritina AB1)]|nr:hypothetical protein AB833_10590 [Chromatiales bacterium (ex Bugula neritina AB1)]